MSVAVANERVTDILYASEGALHRLDMISLSEVRLNGGMLFQWRLSNFSVGGRGRQLTRRYIYVCIYMYVCMHMYLSVIIYVHGERSGY